MSDTVKVALISLLATVLTAVVANIDKISAGVSQVLVHADKAQNNLSRTTQAARQEKTDEQALKEAQILLEALAPKLVRQRWQGGTHIRTQALAVEQSEQRQAIQLVLFWNVSDSTYPENARQTQYQLEGVLLIDALGNVNLKPKSMNQPLKLYEQGLNSHRGDTISFGRFPELATMTALAESK